MTLTGTREPSIINENSSSKSPMMWQLNATLIAWCPPGMRMPSDGLNWKQRPSTLAGGIRVNMASIGPTFAITNSYEWDEKMNTRPVSTTSYENLTLGPMPRPRMRRGKRDSRPVMSQNAVRVNSEAVFGRKTTLTSTVEFGHTSPSTGSMHTTSSTNSISSASISCTHQQRTMNKCFWFTRPLTH